MKDSNMWQLDLTQWKTQNMLQLDFNCERFKYVVIKFYSVKGSSMCQLDFNPWKAQACDN
jgi:hypothetical protein